MNLRAFSLFVSSTLVLLCLTGCQIDNLKPSDDLLSSIHLEHRDPNADRLVHSESRLEDNAISFEKSDHKKDEPRFTSRLPQHEKNQPQQNLDQKERSLIHIPGELSHVKVQHNDHYLVNFFRGIASHVKPVNDRIYVVKDTKRDTSFLKNWSNDKVVKKQRPYDPWHFVWSNTVKPNHNYELSLMPAYDGQDTVFVASTEGDVTAFRLSTGKRLWRQVLPGKERISAGLLLSGQSLYFVTYTGTVYAMSTDKGTILWQMPLQQSVVSMPVMDVDTHHLLIKDIYGALTLLEPTSGHQLAQYHGHWVNDIVLRDPAPISVAAGHYFIPSSSGRLTILRSAGDLVWTKVLVPAAGLSEVERLSDLLGPVVVRDHLFCALAFHQGFGCYNQNKNQLAWFKSLSSSYGPAFDDQKAYVALDDGSVESFYLSSGDRAWQSAFLGSIMLTRPVLFKNFVVVATRAARVAILSQETGRLVHQLFFSNRMNFFMPPLVLPSGLLLVSQQGFVYYIKYVPKS